MRVYKEKELFKETYFVKSSLRIIRSENDSIGDIIVALIDSLYSLDVNAKVSIISDEGRDYDIAPVYSDDYKSWSSSSNGVKVSVNSGTKYIVTVSLIVNGNSMCVKFLTDIPDKLTVSGNSKDYYVCESELINKLNKI